MEQAPKRMDPATMSSATYYSKQRMENVIKRATDMQTDPERAARIEAGVCKGCYYQGGRIGGQAFTTRPCMSCAEPQTYSSTATDALCKPCAKKHGLCKQCGGDRELVMRRKWPTPDQAQEAN